MGILIITHHDRLLEHNVPDFTHVMLGGRIVETGGVELARELYTEGYDRIRAAYPEAAAASDEMRQRRPQQCDANITHSELRHRSNPTP